jgi:hypothetical protein
MRYTLYAGSRNLASGVLSDKYARLSQHELLFQGSFNIHIE